MAKVKSKWICQNCGYETAGYLGKCPDCSEWGSLVEEKIAPSNKASNIQINLGASIAKPLKIKEIEIDEAKRTTSGISEFDRILGGGFVKGSLVLLGGEPGIGKSTLLLQTCSKISNEASKALYISAEESASQIKLRAQRLGVDSDNLYILAQTNIEEIIETIKDLKPEFLIADSIQAIYSSNISSSPGSVSQVRECTNSLMNIAKTTGTTVLIVGHVTKEGSIAGPKVLEHMVDAVIYFEGERYKSYRILRSIKNRFGSTNEVGLFDMQSNGLIEVENPSELFLNERCETITPGSVVIATSEGTRPLLVEIQSLVGTTSYPSPRRVTTGLEYNRALQIVAVLEKRIGLDLSKQDIYVNVIGGLSIKEPAADLGIALAIATCARNVIVGPKTVIIGEIGLSGEVRAVNNIEKRLAEAQKLGFEKAIIPKSNLPLSQNFKGLELIGVSRVMEAMRHSLEAEKI